MKRFVDTSGWIALFDRSDQYHGRASRAVQMVQGQNFSLLTSDYILDETLTHLLYMTGRDIALRFGQWVMSASYVDMIHINEGTWKSAWKMFQAYEDKQWAFTDCTSFVLMHEHNLWQAFAFDHHFEQAGFQLWPSNNGELDSKNT